MAFDIDMRRLILVAVVFLLSPRICATEPTRSIESPTEPRLVFISDHESRNLSEIFLYDHRAPKAFIKVNSPLPSGCPWWTWYRRFIEWLFLSVAHASSGDPRAGCYQGVLNFWVTPDGRYVIYVANSGEVNHWNLHVVDIDDPGHSETINKPQSQHQMPHIAAISPDSKNIIYSSQPESAAYRSLFHVNLKDPSTQHEFAVPTSDREIVAVPKFNPDGELVAYLRISTETNAASVELKKTSALGSRAKVVADDMDYTSGKYAFTAGGNYIIYASITDDPSEHHLELVSTSNPDIRLRIDENFPSTSGRFVLSPNRRMLAYATKELDSDEPITHFIDLMKLGIPTYSEAELSELSLAHEYRYPFSPDSLSFVTYTRDKNYSEQLFWYFIERPSERISVTPTLTDDSTRIDIGFYPTFTPDGSNLIYIASLDRENRRELYLSNIGEPEHAELISAASYRNGHVHSFVMSANGRYAAYVANKQYQPNNIFLVDLEVRDAPTQITNSPRRRIGARSVAGVEFLPPGPVIRD